MNHTLQGTPERVAACMLALCLLTFGCAAEFGVGGGVQARAGHALGFGRVAASTKLGEPLGERGWLIGAELESRAEQAVGARWDGGILLGWGQGPAAVDDTLGYEAYVEFGTPLRSTLFARKDFYAGAAVAIPIFIGSPRHIADLNNTTFILTHRFELVPLARVRFHLDHEPEAPSAARLDFSAGVSLRMHVASDFF